MWCNYLEVHLGWCHTAVQRPRTGRCCLWVLQGGLGRGQTRRGFPAVEHFKAFKAKVPKMSFCVFAEGGQKIAIQKNIEKLLL